MSGGGGSQTSYTQQSSKSSSEPPAYLQPYLKEGVANLAGLYNASGQKAPDYYPGSTVAPLSAATNQALQGTVARATNGSPLVKGAQALNTDTIYGKFLDPNANPYWRGALEAGFASQTDNFLNRVVPGITSAFEGSGRTGSGAHQAAVDAATMDLNRAQAEASATAASNFYQSERGRQVDAANNAPALANNDYTDLAMLGQAGSGYDTFAQRNLDADIARYNYTQNKDWNYLARYLGMLNGAYPGGETSGSSFGTSVMPQQQSSPLGAIMGGAGLAMQMLPMFGISDARAKDIHGRVGQTDDGTPLYLYNYKGESDPRVGPMAQEVAQTNPDAVARHPSGYLMVDYNKVAQRSRGFI